LASLQSPSIPRTFKEDHKRGISRSNQFSQKVWAKKDLYMIEFFGKILIFIGGILIFLGLIFSFVGRIPYLGKLPGDIYIKREKFTFYFPITTCILISIILSVIFYLISRFLK
jgi:hypothetical protein